MSAELLLTIKIYNSLSVNENKINGGDGLRNNAVKASYNSSINEGKSMKKITVPPPAAVYALIFKHKKPKTSNQSINQIRRAAKSNE